MKILSYNISTCKQWKVDRLLEIDADIFVVPEMACAEQMAIPESHEMAWNGIKWEYGEDLKSKGLGIIWKKGCGVIPEWYMVLLCWPSGLRNAKVFLTK